MKEPFTVQDLIDMLNILSEEDKQLPIAIIDYRGHYVSPTSTWKDYFNVVDSKPTLVLIGEIFNGLCRQTSENKI